MRRSWPVARESGVDTTFRAETQCEVFPAALGDENQDRRNSAQRSCVGRGEQLQRFARRIRLARANERIGIDARPFGDRLWAGKLPERKNRTLAALVRRHVS